MRRLILFLIRHLLGVQVRTVVRWSVRTVERRTSELRGTKENKSLKKTNIGKGYPGDSVTSQQTHTLSVGHFQKEPHPPMHP
jgi:hypothetical protein